MAVNSPYSPKQITVDNASWTALTAPFDSLSVIIPSDTAVDVKFRSDPNDATTQATIPAGSELPIDGFVGSYDRFRFRAGQVVGYLQATLGTVTIAPRWKR